MIFTDEINRFFDENNAILIHGDYTNENPEITEWMKEFGRAGVPFLHLVSGRFIRGGAAA